MRCLRKPQLTQSVGSEGINQYVAVPDQLLEYDFMALVFQIQSDALFPSVPDLSKLYKSLLSMGLALSPILLNPLTKVTWAPWSASIMPTA